MKILIINRGLDLLNLLMRIKSLLMGIKKEHRLLVVLMVLWGLMTEFWSSPEMTAGINESVPLMVILALISFLILLELVWWLLNRFWNRVGLPGIEVLVIYYRRWKNGSRSCFSGLHFRFCCWREWVAWQRWCRKTA